jgi:hypothetical protein
MEHFYGIRQLVNKMKTHNMSMNECVIVFAIIEKLPPSWKDYSKSLKHKQSELSLVELESHLKIEEDECIREGSSKIDGITGKVMIVNFL